jgi:hypothetical protein
VSDECCTTSIDYEPPPPYPPDPLGVDIPWLLVLPLIILLVAIIFLWSTAPATPRPVVKTPRQKINDALDALVRDAQLYQRPEVVGPLQEARKKIMEILDG